MNVHHVDDWMNALDTEPDMPVWAYMTCEPGTGRWEKVDHSLRDRVRQKIIHALGGEYELVEREYRCERKPALRPFANKVTFGDFTGKDDCG